MPGLFRYIARWAGNDKILETVAPAENQRYYVIDVVALTDSLAAPETAALLALVLGLYIVGGVCAAITAFAGTTVSAVGSTLLGVIDAPLAHLFELLFRVISAPPAAAFKYLFTVSGIVVALVFGYLFAALGAVVTLVFASLFTMSSVVVVVGFGLSSTTGVTAAAMVVTCPSAMVRCVMLSHVLL
jgi:hypothetical protein